MEAEFIQWLSGRLTSPAARGMRDDAALLDEGARVVTTDLLLEGVHFQLDEAGPRLAGRKALAASLSDLAAMAAAPRAAVVSLGLPRKAAGRVAREVIEGMAPLAEQHGLEIVGGDTTTWDGPLVINVAAWGDPVHGVLSRSEGRPGDTLLVTGSLGGSLLGRHLRFEPRVGEALWLMEHHRPHAAIDISDGLALDLSRLASASQCGAVVVADRVPVAEAAARRAAQSGRTPLEHALHDGEDFELLLAMAPADAQRAADAWPAEFPPLTSLGRLDEQAGLWLEDERQRREPLRSEGYLHGESAP